eukprot:gb/GECH01010981.1/.p1 GENE.gb/GECH01010981.1/~~gb/GECH01010981.1/.p1  ORF type:complete len:178 (+),score=31.85 gb/GECH01010981.1/:1-534(+)
MMMMMMISNYSFDELYFADFLMFLKIHLHLQIQDLRDVYDKHPVPFPSVMLLPQSTAASPDPPSPSPAASPPLAASDALPAFGGVLPSYVAAPGFLQLPINVKFKKKNYLNNNNNASHRRCFRSAAHEASPPRRKPHHRLYAEAPTSENHFWFCLSTPSYSTMITLSKKRGILVFLN